MPLKKILADLSRSVWAPSSGKKNQKITPRFYPGTNLTTAPLGGHHIYYEPPDDFDWSADVALLPPSQVLTGEVFLQSRVALPPLADEIKPSSKDGQETVEGRAYTEEEFTSAILARKQAGSWASQEADPSLLSGQNHSKAATEEGDALLLLPMGENGEVSLPNGTKDSAATDYEGEKQSLKTPAPRLDSSVSPVPERRNKGVLGRLKSFASRTSYSTSEDGHSHSSDYEEQDEEKKPDVRFQREAKERNSASWVRHLRRDVKRRISRLRNNRPTANGEVKESVENTDGPLQTGSSVESIPSGSGSSLQPPTPTSSNRSSTSAGEDENSAYVGAFLGRARALVDYTPSPYDRDGLAFKKGDVIDIIAKHKTGIWVGMVQGRVGHFKFINVEEISLDEWKPRPKKYKVPAQWLATANRPETLEQLLKQLSLVEYMNVFVLNGYDELDTFKEIEREDLESLGIVNPEHTAKLLRAVEMLQGIDGEAEEEEAQLMQSPRDSGCYASNENLGQQDSVRRNSSSRLPDGEDVDTSHSESGIHSREGPDLTMPMNNLDLSTESSTKSTLTTLDSREDVPDPPEGSDEPVNFNIIPSQAEADTPPDQTTSPQPVEMDQRVFEPKESEPFVPVTTFANCISSSTLRENGVSTNCSTLPTVSETCVSMPNIRDMSPVNFAKESRNKGSRSKQNCRKSKDKDSGKQFSRGHQTLVKHREMEFPFDGNPYSHGFASFPKKDKKHSRRRVQEYDDIVSDPAIDPEESPRRNIYKRTKQRKGSLQELVRNPRPPSVSLLSLVKQKLEQENINLFEEPYSDKTGFCGIPPALVQRYADELHQSLTDVAGALDQIRITSLQQQARRGVPNDFLADSCTVPVIEANYSCLHNWLISLGLPMYEANFSSAGCRHLEQVTELNPTDLTYLGIRDQRHQLLLESAIFALKTRFGECVPMPVSSYPMG